MPGVTVAEAVEVLAAGGIVGVPTDTVYGLAVVPTDPNAVGRLFDLKDRPTAKPVALLVASVEQAETIVSFTPLARDLAERHWPGALTLVLPPPSLCPHWVGDAER